MNKLIPRRVTIESELKYFTLGEHGTTDGSRLGVEFEVPTELTAAELVREQFEEKERLDLRVLTMEFAKGHLPKELFDARKKFLKETYDKILKRENGSTVAAA